MTPHIVQKLLAAMNDEIILSDGSILNAQNATKVLQYDLYFKYSSKNYVPGRETISDQLFAEAAQKTMQKLMGTLTISHMLEYISVAKESFDNRTMMLWMKDDAEQALISQLDWNAGLNTDPTNPKAGIYYNCTIPSKMGLFLLIDTQIGERIYNEDGSCTYPITVTFTNNMTQEELSIASGYITGNLNGAITRRGLFLCSCRRYYW